jgi:hypothetical protein
MMSLVKLFRVKGKLLPGVSRTLEFEKEFIGKFKDGWKVSSDKYDKTPGGFLKNKYEKNENEVSFNGIGIDYFIFYQFLFK